MADVDLIFISMLSLVSNHLKIEIIVFSLERVLYIYRGCVSFSMEAAILQHHIPSEP